MTEMGVPIQFASLYDIQQEQLYTWLQMTNRTDDVLCENQGDFPDGPNLEREESWVMAVVCSEHSVMTPQVHR